MLGTFMTDINLGIYTAELDLGDCIYATSEQLRDPASSLPRRAAGRLRARARRRRHPRPKRSAAAGADRLRNASRSSLRPDDADHRSRG